MAFKRRGLLSMTPEEVQSKIQKIAEVVEVPEETARQMVVIQPGLLFETDKQAETLKYGIRSICYELNASKEEVGLGVCWQPVKQLCTHRFCPGPEHWPLPQLSPTCFTCDLQSGGQADHGEPERSAWKGAAAVR